MCLGLLGNCKLSQEDRDQYTLRTTVSLMSLPTCSLCLKLISMQKAWVLWSTVLTFILPTITILAIWSWIASHLYQYKCEGQQEEQLQ